VFISRPVPPVSLPITLRSGAQDDLRMGEISGSVFEDLNGNGVQDIGEKGLEGQRVFLDMNDNGIQEENEPGMDTDSRGRYHFPGLALTRYRVRQKLQKVAQTTPDRNLPHEVELTAQNSSVNGKDFGAKIILFTPVTGQSGDNNTSSTPETPSPSPREAGPQEPPPAP
jgi:hypothetical protein